MTIHTYIVHFKNGGTCTITASNISGAKAQMLGVLPYVAFIERVYQSGERATAPF